MTRWVRDYDSSRSSVIQAVQPARRPAHLPRERGVVLEPELTASFELQRSESASVYTIRMTASSMNISASPNESPGPTISTFSRCLAASRTKSRPRRRSRGRSRCRGALVNRISPRGTWNSAVRRHPVDRPGELRTAERWRGRRILILAASTRHRRWPTSRRRLACTALRCRRPTGGAGRKLRQSAGGGS